jgi:hypothetical protein
MLQPLERLEIFMKDEDRSYRSTDPNWRLPLFLRTASRVENLTLSFVNNDTHRDLDSPMRPPWMSLDDVFGIKETSTRNDFNHVPIPEAPVGSFVYTSVGPLIMDVSATKTTISSSLPSYQRLRRLVLDRMTSIDTALVSLLRNASGTLEELSLNQINLSHNQGSWPSVVAAMRKIFGSRTLALEWELVLCPADYWKLAESLGYLKENVEQWMYDSRGGPLAGIEEFVCHGGCNLLAAFLYDPLII